MNKTGYFDYDKEPRRAILFEDVKSNYASIECVQRDLTPLTTSLCVMSRADNSFRQILGIELALRLTMDESSLELLEKFRHKFKPDNKVQDLKICSIFVFPLLYVAIFQI